MPDIRIIALDLDGTLLRSDKTIDPLTADALRSLVARGLHVILASARPPRSVRGFYRQLGLSSVQINYNGALTWDEHNQSPLSHDPLPHRVAHEIIATARRFFPEVIVQAEVLDRLYTDRIDARYDTETGRLFKADRIAPITEWEEHDITKLMLLGEPAAIAGLRAQLLSMYSDSVVIMQSDPDLLQIAKLGTGKGVALARLARALNIDSAEVFAIGDAENDLDMLNFAGVSVAMQHAPDTVKRAASFIAPTNDHQGVLRALQMAGLVNGS